MHIVMLLSNAFRPDPRVLKEAQSLSNSGIRVSIVCWDRMNEFQSNETLFENVNIYRIQNIKSTYGIGLRQISTLLRFWRLAIPLITKLNPDIVHCHDFDTIFLGIFWGKIHRKPIVYDAHEYYADLVLPRLSRIIGKILYRLIRITDKFVAAMSDAVVTVDKNLAKIYRQYNNQILIIGHYPQKSFIQKDSRSFTHEQLILLYAGRISQDRGSLVYLNLLRSLINMGIPTKLRFVGIYTPPDEEFIVQRNLSGLENYFEYLGWIPYQKMIEIYKSADIGLSILMPIPRYISALPVKMFEYMACGLPIVASNFPSIIEIMDETNCGLYIDPHFGIDEVARSIEQWWIHPTIPKMIGENGIKAVSNKYNWELQINNLVKLYYDLIN